MSDTQGDTPKKRQLRLEIPNNLSATYANGVVISQTNNEVILDFIQLLPNDPRTRVQHRIVMTPTHAKMFLKALETNLARYEAKHGEIKLPALPASLADELFSSVRSDDEHDEDEDESADNTGDKD